MARNVLDPRRSGELIAKLSTNLSIRDEGITSLSESIYHQLIQKPLTTNYFTQNEVHPRCTDDWAADWICLVDTLNFCFWPLPSLRMKPWKVVYKNKKYGGYFALCAAINKAKESGNWGDITDPAVYSKLQEKDLAEIVKGPENTAPLCLLKERIHNLKEVGTVLIEKYNGSFKNVIKACNGSAVSLLSLIVEDFPCFRDEAMYKGHHVAFYKRAQILVADIWNCFEGKDLGAFHDIDSITMFADYRVPQSLIYFEVLQYTDELMDKIKKGKLLESGGEEEVEIRGCSIHAVELLCSKVRELLEKEGKKHNINSIVLDNFLWEFRRKESLNINRARIPYHKTKCIFY